MAIRLDLILGIPFGLTGALFQSLSYLATRHFVQRRPSGASRTLLVLAHVWMGVISLAILPFVWPWGLKLEWAPIALPLVTCAGFYLVGQIGLMMALRHTEPSRVSPLLGFKIVILAFMASLWGQPGSVPGAGHGLGMLQWAAVVLCVVATFSLNFSGVALPGRAIFGLLLAVVTYSISDWNITILVAAVKHETNFGYVKGSIFAACLTYVLCGLIGACLLPLQGSGRWRDWRGSIPFSLAWYAGMLCLYASFGFVGVVCGNILQSTRGLMSVIISAFLIRWGLLHLEPVSTRGAFYKRLGAAALMILAVTLYVQGLRKDDTMRRDTTQPTPTGATK